MAEFKSIDEAEFVRKQRPAISGFRAESARFDTASGQLQVQLTNGVTAGFPVTLIKGLETASPQDLAHIEIQGRGFGLHIPNLDADISVVQLFSDFLGSQVMAQAERRMIASRDNGRKGGRPTLRASAGC
ncbi:DUF2442 domain-containing protein [Asticcacaulis taihuensis]|jgi:hypothetical protein|uniref:DUF2442 domain-containing protein n=1 Tax=Asticcacaulis taihuensis TaxID=260084 RepID=UPI0026EEBAF0|nr:DUF2442 domain-containing protein [Asticcacaulis taihuensis]